MKLQEEIKIYKEVLTEEEGKAKEEFLFEYLIIEAFKEEGIISEEVVEEAFNRASKIYGKMENKVGDTLKKGYKRFKHSAKQIGDFKGKHVIDPDQKEISNEKAKKGFDEDSLKNLKELKIYLESLKKEAAEKEEIISKMVQGYKAYMAEGNVKEAKNLKKEIKEAKTQLIYETKHGIIKKIKGIWNIREIKDLTKNLLTKIATLSVPFFAALGIMQNPVSGKIVGFLLAGTALGGVITSNWRIRRTKAEELSNTFNNFKKDETRQLPPPSTKELEFKEDIEFTY